MVSQEGWVPELVSAPEVDQGIVVEVARVAQPAKGRAMEPGVARAALVAAASEHLLAD
ncbi:hypothetical protein Z945_3474 [Sulfitobacter noctilucae]|nr:hypothetical protein Z945_3474 [Sulfitobacter noctilucae]